MNLAQIEEESDKRTEIKLSKALEAETRDFDAQTNKSVEIMPYTDEEMIFRQQGRRVGWGRKNARYVAARYYPNADCARKIIDELVRRGTDRIILGGRRMKKDLKWLKEEVKNYIEPYDEEDWLSYKAGTTDVAELILGYIDQVEQPELPEIPDYVAEFIEEFKPFKDIEWAIYTITTTADMKLRKWVFHNDVYTSSEAKDIFARAWLDGFTIEEEQKYYVINNDNRMMLVKMMDGNTITEADPFKLEDMYEVEKKSHRLTEQEIKDYDKRYWVFAEPVEEVEFRLTF